MTVTATRPDILCIGSVLWDIIGLAAVPMPPGADRPGRIRRQPGGVALNVAMALARRGLRPALLTAIGRDADGEDLVEACKGLGLDMSFAMRVDDPTDSYMAIEGPTGLVAAVADAHSLERAGDAILAPLIAGPLGRAEAPYTGRIALDGNLTDAVLARIAGDPILAGTDLRIAPASPGKVLRLRPFLGASHATLYVNREEAELLCGARFADADTAAAALVEAGAARAIVTDGAAGAADAGPSGRLHRPAPRVAVARITGAGDTFMAAHIAAEGTGAGPARALDAALAAAAAHVAGEDVA
jgi:pseudouridine kinase